MTAALVSTRFWVAFLISVAAASVLACEGRAQRSVSPTEMRVDSSASKIDYTGSAPMHDWTGTSRDVRGRLAVAPAAPESSRVVIEAPVASFDSGNDRRDRKMRKVTDASRHPTVRFEAREIRPKQWGRAGGGGWAGTWAVQGALTFHGRTHPVEATVNVHATEDSVRARARFPVSLTRFEVDRPKLLWVPIGDTIRIDARILARPEGPAAPPETRR
jgi:polyisoprenoid-binding protein YceI